MGEANSDLLDEIESMARQHCYTDKAGKHEGVPETNITDSGGTSADASALRTLAQHGRFRIVREYGRMVVGYWPEHDPNAALRITPYGARGVIQRVVGQED